MLLGCSDPARFCWSMQEAALCKPPRGIVADVADAERIHALGVEGHLNVRPHAPDDVFHPLMMSALLLVEAEVADDPLEPRATENLTMSRRFFFAGRTGSRVRIAAAQNGASSSQPGARIGSAPADASPTASTDDSVPPSVEPTTTRRSASGRSCHGPRARSSACGSGIGSPSVWISLRAFGFFDSSEKKSLMRLPLLRILKRPSR